MTDKGEVTELMRTPANYFLAVFSICITTLLLYFSIYRNHFYWDLTLTLFVVGLTTALIVTLGSFFANQELRINLSLLIFTVVLFLYLGEVALLGINRGWFQEAPENFDTRNEKEVITDLRNKGKQVFPNFPPASFISEERDKLIETEAGNFFPLGGLGNARIVLCNESGTWVKSRNDTFGFRNPSSVWDKPVEVELLGNSFVQGYCVETGKSFADRIRSQHPRTINLGMAGNGPLLELATLKEFGPVTKPSRVFWFFFAGNDLQNLGRELESPLLKKYLQKSDFRQKIFKNNRSIQRNYREQAANTVKKELSQQSSISESFTQQLSHLARLPFTRRILGLGERELKQPHLVLKRFEEIIVEANRVIEKWGGELYFVYLPSQRDFGGTPLRPIHDLRRPISKRVTKHDIPILDLESIIRRKVDRPLNLFPSGGGHFNAEGHRLVAREIVRILNEADTPP